MEKKILNILKEIDPLEQNRILSNVADSLKRERIEKSNQIKKQLFIIENSLQK